MNWLKRLKGSVKYNEPLDKYTSLRIGAEADIFVIPRDLSDLKLLIKSAKKYRIPFFIIGQGTNLLIRGKRTKGFIIKLSSPYFKKIGLRGNIASVGSGVRLSELIAVARKKGLSGLEFLSGIPGSLGGAIAMNAGVSGRGIGDLVREVKVMDYTGNVKALKGEQIKFSYRYSALSKYIILSAKLNLVKKNNSEIGEIIKYYIDNRKNLHSIAYPSAGCVFKNPVGESAGRLIDLCGLKGKSSGAAEISRQHANYIINRGKAKAEDVLKLMELVQRKVKLRFGIDLEPEIKIW